MRNVWSLGVALCLLFGLGGVAVVTGFAEDTKAEAPKAAQGYELAVPLDSIMYVMSDIFDKIPEKAKAGKFKEARRESHLVAEVANIAAHEKENRSKKEWVDLAEAMKVSALKMAEAALKKDEAAVKSAHAAVETTCNNCHEKFRD
ncbi:MAG TPA: cytochrome c [Planctomycetota bacterium]|nr:cytochrome c [Planctomycetota bacterium]